MLILSLEAETCLVKGLLVSFFFFLNKKGEPLVINVLHNLQPIEPLIHPKQFINMLIHPPKELTNFVYKQG